MSHVRAGEFGELKASGVWMADSFTFSESYGFTADAICLKVGDVTRADPRIRLNAAKIRAVFQGAGLLPGARFSVRDDAGKTLCLYVIRHYDAERDCYEAEWPD